MGDYKESQTFCSECATKAENQRLQEQQKKKEAELEEQRKKEAELEKQYQEALHSMDEIKLDQAAILFKKLGDYKDSKQKAEECDKKIAKRKEKEQKAKKKKRRAVFLTILTLFVVGLATYLIISMKIWKADESGHWHPILGSQSSYSAHDWDFVWEKLPTCEESGIREYKCTICGTRHQDRISPLGHTVDSEGVVTEEPTCNTLGRIEYRCSTCGEVVKTESIPAKGHTSDSGKATKEPTCTEKGIKTYTCTTCGEVVKTEPIAAKGHTSDSGKVTKEPTCTEKGIKTYTCTTCGEVVKTESIATKGHTSDSGKVTKEPTCTENGVKTYSCKTCGVVLKTESIDMKPHSFIDTVIVQPQCETRGRADSKCSVCGYTTTRILDATGHDWESTHRVDSSCTADGYENFVCKTCKKNIEEVIPATGHKWVAIKTVYPGCVSDGYIDYKCSVCGTTKKEKTDAKGHNYLDGLCIDCGFDRNQYHVGDIGPTGGYIFYDCDADNNSGNKDGLVSTKCGWRFLESAPADVRVVDGIPTIDTSVSGYSSAKTGYIFGYYRETENGKNQNANGKKMYNTGEAVGTGKSNTQSLVSFMGTDAYSSGSGSEKTENYAARLCEILTYSVNGEEYGDWFLPSKDELNLMYTNLSKKGLGGFADKYYWSSSEYSSFSWEQYLGNEKGQGYTTRESNLRVRPVRAF